MIKKLLVALSLAVSTPAMADTVLEQRGYGTWSFYSTADEEGTVTCTSVSSWEERPDLLFFYQTIGGDLLEDIVFFDPVLAFADVESFDLVLFRKDGSYDAVPMDFHQQEGQVRTRMTDEVFARVIRAEKFAVFLNGDNVASGWIYPEAFKAVRACRASAAIMEGMGVGEEI